MRKVNKKIVGVISLCLILILVVIGSFTTNDNKLNEKVEIEGDYFALLVDDKESSTLPQAGVYLIDYTCDNNSKIEWDRSTGKLSISKNTSVTENCSLTFKTNPLASDLPQGSYIAYEGNNGCLRNGTATATVTTSGQGANENSNSCLGYNANANIDGSKDSTYGMYGYCYVGDYRYYVSGWRIAYTKDNRAYIISAGSPECTTRRNSTNGNADYITDSYLDAKKYCNSSYVDDCTSDTDVHAINDTDYNLMTAEATNTAGGYLYTSISGATKCGGVHSKEVCGYNNDLIDNGGYYWFASAYSASDPDGVSWYPAFRYVNSYSFTYAYGLRPVIRLSSSVYITGGSGTMDDPYVINNMTFSINSNASYTTNSTVNLKLVGDGVSQMCISNTESCTNYESFAESKEWTLSSGDGEKTVYVYYKDSSGNVIASISKSIILDTTPPSNNSIQISSEDNITRTLTLSSTGADYMCFSNTSSNISDCTSWVDYKTSYTWSLTPNSGEKTVYAFFKDKAGNTASTSASVTCNNCITFTVSEDFSDTTYDSNLTIAGSGDYPWTVDTTNLYFKSTNNGVNSSSSTSTIVFIPTNASKLSFDWGVSSESGWDKLTIKLTGSDSSSVTLVDAQSGTKTGSITDQALSANVTYTLTLTYTKDSSSASGSDIGYIDNLHIGS